MGTLLQFIERIMVKTNDSGKVSYVSDYEDRDVVVDPKTGEPREVWKPKRSRYDKHDSQRKFKSLGTLKTGGHKGKITRLINKSMGNHIKWSQGSLTSRSVHNQEVGKAREADHAYVKALNAKRYGAEE